MINLLVRHTAQRRAKLGRARARTAQSSPVAKMRPKWSVWRRAGKVCERFAGEPFASLRRAANFASAAAVVASSRPREGLLGCSVGCSTARLLGRSAIENVINLKRRPFLRARAPNTINCCQPAGRAKHWPPPLVAATWSGRSALVRSASRSAPTHILGSRVLCKICWLGYLFAVVVLAGARHHIQIIIDHSPPAPDDIARRRLLCAR